MCDNLYLCKSLIFYLCSLTFSSELWISCWLRSNNSCTYFSWSSFCYLFFSASSTYCLASSSLNFNFDYSNLYFFYSFSSNCFKSCNYETIYQSSEISSFFKSDSCLTTSRFETVDLTSDIRDLTSWVN